MCPNQSYFFYYLLRCSLGQLLLFIFVVAEQNFCVITCFVYYIHSVNMKYILHKTYPNHYFYCKNGKTSIDFFLQNNFISKEQQDSYSPAITSSTVNHRKYKHGYGDGSLD